ETNATLTFADANATLHDGNYSVVVSNDFGAVPSTMATFTVVDSSLGSGLVGWWRFDETNSSIAHDSSGNDNNGTLTDFGSNTAPWVTGKIGGALSFDGNNDQVLLPNAAHPMGAELTVAFWANGGSSLPKQTTLLESELNGNRVINIHFPSDDGTIYWDVGPGGEHADRIQKTPVESDYKNLWAHWAFTKNVTTGIMEMHRNGSLWQSGTGKTLPLPSSQVTSFRIGAFRTGAAHFWHGKLDDLRIYDRVLTESEIQTLYDLGQ
ncbi:MAG: LamG domain-containing protein, partial [Opitutales bacterium]